MDLSNPNDPLLNVAVASIITVITIILTLMENEGNDRQGIAKEPSLIREQWRQAHMYRILTAGPNNCAHYLRMSSGAFYGLANILRSNGSLHDTFYVCVEEQLAIFLYMLGHKAKNRVCGIEFIRSGETISRYFNKVLGAVCSIQERFVKQLGSETPMEIRNAAEWFPYFEDCIGMIDGTHIQATLPASIVARFRGRKQVTQNVLAACTPDKKFTYVLAGWEGCANDMTILKDVLSMPSPHGLKVIAGKYYLADAGYTTMPDLSLIVDLGTTSILRGIVTLPMPRNCSTIGILSCVAKLNAHLPPSRTDSAS
ncbi:uncharacterized protein M6B38_180295 [Iris pallida]|uniref:DDE Tnp4 domain-containing protein n=1 Tax=Iris pallida TaxID=29817 RepID=A0AAX6EMX3_IRIPA|nr:uncharacterized protein M6B38_180295 [Iris pallida]